MQLILEEASAGNDDAVVGKVSSQRFVIENLKHVYFNASHESTAVAASRCLMLLALQSRVAIPFMRRVVLSLIYSFLLDIKHPYHV